MSDCMRLIVAWNTFIDMHYSYCTHKNMHRCNIGALPFWQKPPVTSLAHAWSTCLAPAQFHIRIHNRSITDPHTRVTRLAPAQPPPLLEDPTRIGVGPSELEGKCLKHDALAYSHGIFLHVAHQTLELPAPLHYISRDHPKAHELTNHIRHPSPEPGLLSPGAPGKWLRRRFQVGIVPM